MIVQELIEKLERCPKMNEVYVQSFYSALNKVDTKMRTCDKLEMEKLYGEEY